ncbi:M23 family metallopeptidase [Candidatus Pacearchaeota archaeon]|nr:M23 family metallopeptidase [Candidatus Pacearchaeota archaeon]
MINEEARRERHARLKQQNIPLNNPSTDSTGQLSTSVHSKVEQLFQESGNPMLRLLSKKMFAIVAAFLILSPFMSTYQLTQGAYVGQMMEGGFEEMGIGGNAEYDIADIMTEDGFLLKPALNSTEGDRTGFSDVFVYTVEPGDTISTIAQQFSLKKETLMAENNLWNPNRLRVGVKLKVLPVDGLSHVVKKGETVEKIAKKYKVEADALFAQNQLKAEDELEADRVLIVPGAKRSAPVYRASSAPSGGGNYQGPTAVGRLIWPTIGKLTQGYHRGHTALDIADRAKGPIYAAAAGKVIKSQGGWNGGYGNYIILDHGNGMQTLYGHNEKLYVTVGQYVEQGQTIAWMGNSGRVYGPTGIHLHFEVRIKGVKYNPMSFF